MATINQLVRKPRSPEPTRARRPRWRTARSARRVHARLHHHPEEAELGAAQGRQGAPDQRLRGHLLHRRRRPQPAGALGGADPRRPRQGPAGRALPHRARLARRRRRRQAPPEPFEVRRQAPEGLIRAR